MKKQLLVLFIGLITFSVQAQLVLSDAGQGKVNVEYGASGDWSLYDPSGDAIVYVYLWVNQDQASPALSEAYTDDWNSSATLVQLSYVTDRFVGEIDFNTHDFTGSGGVIPSSTSLSNFNLILRNEGGDRKSADLVASDYGFTSTVLNIYDHKADANSYYFDGKLHLISLSADESIALSVFDISGKQIFMKQFISTGEEKVIDISNLKGTFAIIQVKTSTNKYFVKKIIL